MSREPELSLTGGVVAGGGFGAAGGLPANVGVAGVAGDGGAEAGGDVAGGTEVVGLVVGGRSDVGGGDAGVGGGAGVSGGGAGGDGGGGGLLSCGRRFWHWPWALFSTTLPSPTGAGVLSEHSKLPPIEFPEIETPPVLPDALTLPSISLLRISKADRLLVSVTLPRISVLSMLLLSPTSSSRVTLPSMSPPSMATKSARLPVRLPRMLTSRAISEPPEKSVTLPLTFVRVSWQRAAISRLPRTSTSPMAPVQLAPCAAAQKR